MDLIVIDASSPLVDSIVAVQIVNMGRPAVEATPTSGQRLQADRHLVARVLNICFWASLACDEGRRVGSGVTFASPDEGLDQFKLARQEALTVDSLIHLGTVAGTSQRLAIHEHNGNPYIWGFLRGRAPPSWVTVWFDQPARLRIIMEQQGVLSMLDRGRVLIPEGHLVANPWNLREQLQSLLSPLPVAALDGLQFVADEMSRHGHGGTLLVVPENSTGWETHIRITHALDESSRTLLSRMQQRSSHPRTADPIVAEAFRDEFRRAARQVADFTKIDGAAVIGSDLTAHGLGAWILSPDSDRPRPPLVQRTIYAKDFVPAEWIELGGTRHQSSARFVSATKDSAAFVASHDGGLSALAWNVDIQRLEWLQGLEGLVVPR